MRVGEQIDRLRPAYEAAGLKVIVKNNRLQLSGREAQQDVKIGQVVLSGAGADLASIRRDSEWFGTIFAPVQAIQEELGEAYQLRGLNELGLAFMYSVRLTQLNEKKSPCQGAGGLLVERSGRTFVFTAAHAIKKGTWVLNTNVNSDDLSNPWCLQIPLRAEWVVEATFEGEAWPEREVDFGWAEITEGQFEDLRRGISQNPLLQGKQVELPVFTGAFARPGELGNYLFCGQRQAEFDGKRKTLSHVPSYETGMRFVGIDKGVKTEVYCFKPPRAHQGDAYYEGISGTPIFDLVSLDIVSLVLCGSETANRIYGLRLQDYLDKIPAEVIPRPSSAPT